MLFSTGRFNKIRYLPFSRKVLSLVLKNRIKNIKSVSQYQDAFEAVVSEVIKNSIKKFSITGIENLDPNKGYLFVANIGAGMACTTFFVLSIFLGTETKRAMPTAVVIGGWTSWLPTAVSYVNLESVLFEGKLMSFSIALPRISVLMQMNYLCQVKRLSYGKVFHMSDF